MSPETFETSPLTSKISIFGVFRPETAFLGRKGTNCRVADTKEAAPLNAQPKMGRGWYAAESGTGSNRFGGGSRAAGSVLLKKSPQVARDRLGTERAVLGGCFHIFAAGEVGRIDLVREDGDEVLATASDGPELAHDVGEPSLVA